MTDRLRDSLHFCVLALLVLASYYGAINNEYVWDDRYFLLDYTWLNSVESALKTAFSPLFMARAYVRPIPLMSLYIEALIWGRNPAVSHAVNIALHLLCSWMVYLLARKTSQDIGKRKETASFIALIIASLFAVHPALSETVIWVSCRFDLLATLFMLIALRFSASKISDWKRAAAVSLFFFLAALSKESAVVFPFVLGAYEILRHAAQNESTPRIGTLFSKRNIKVFSAIFIAGIGYLVVRQIVLGGAIPSVAENIPFGERLARIASTLPAYLKLTIMPLIGNSPQHTFTWDPNLGIHSYVNHIATGLLLSLTLVFLFKKKPIGWIMAIWIACYLPVMHLLPITVGNNAIQQRFMYFPTATILFLLPYCFQKVKLTGSAKTGLYSILALFIIAAVLVNRSIVPVWQNDLILWKWTTQTDPNSVEARENLIWAYLDRGMHTEVDREIKRLTETGAITGPNALINAGVSQHRRLHFKESLYYYEIAYRHIGTLTPDRKSSLLSNMAISYAMLGEDEKARIAIAKAVKFDRHNHMALGNLLAFCKEKNIDLSEYEEEDLKRAMLTNQEVQKLLKKHRAPSIQPGSWPTQLCPE